MVKSDLNQYETELANLNKLIALKPNHSWAIAQRAEIYRCMKRYELALADFNQAIELKPNYVWAIAHRGATYRFLGKPYYELALTDFNQAVELKPDYAWALAYRGLVYELMRCYEAALADFDRAISLDETLFGPYWRGERGLLLSYSERYAEAIQCCQQALQVNPDDYFASYCLAIVQARRQGVIEAKTQIDQARTALQSRQEIDPQPEILYRLGVLAALEGNLDQVWPLLTEAISLGGDDALGFACFDPALIEIRNDPRFQALMARSSSA